MPYTAEQLALLPKSFGYQPLYRLRWRFDFRGKNTIYGGWNSASTNPRDMAAFVNKTGLVRASIEGEMIGSYALKILAEIEGQRYVSMSWLMAASLPVFNPGRFQTQGSIIGLSMFTEIEQYMVYINGHAIIKQLCDHEQKIDVTEHRLGV